MNQARGNKTDRRAELLKVAREIFAEKGFEATTISEIVARAGVAQGTFYWYFSSKAALVSTLAKEMQEQIEQALYKAYAEANHLSEMIDSSVAAAFHIMGQYRDILAIFHSDSRWIGDPANREQIFSPYYGLIAELLRQEQARAAVSIPINPDITAILIVGTVYYAADDCYVFNSPITPDMYIAETAQFIRRALGITSSDPQ